MGLVNLKDLHLNVGESSAPQWSVTVDDYRYVLYSTNKALVFKGDNKEPSYEITALGCSCPGDRYSGNPCKHRKQLLYLGDRSATPPEEGTLVKAKQDKTISRDEFIDISEIDSLLE